MPSSSDYLAVEQGVLEPPAMLQRPNASVSSLIPPVASNAPRSSPSVALGALPPGGLAAYHQIPMNPSAAVGAPPGVSSAGAPAALPQACYPAASSLASTVNLAGVSGAAALAHPNASTRALPSAAAYALPNAAACGLPGAAGLGGPPLAACAPGPGAGIGLAQYQMPPVGGPMNMNTLSAMQLQLLAQLNGALPDGTKNLDDARSQLPPRQ